MIWDIIFDRIVSFLFSLKIWKRSNNIWIITEINKIQNEQETFFRKQKLANILQTNIANKICFQTNYFFLQKLPLKTQFTKKSNLSFYIF